MFSVQSVFPSFHSDISRSRYQKKKFLEAEVCFVSFSSDILEPEVGRGLLSQGVWALLKHEICQFFLFSFWYFQKRILEQEVVRGLLLKGVFSTAGLPHLVFYYCHQSAQGGGEQENIILNMEIKISHIFTHFNVWLRFASKNRR